MTSKNVVADLERDGTIAAQHTARVRSLVLKFEVYRVDPKHYVSEHLRKISSMIQDLKATGSIFTNEQQVQASTALLTQGGSKKGNHFKGKGTTKSKKNDAKLASNSNKIKAHRDTKATKHVTQDKKGFENYQRFPSKSHWCTWVKEVVQKLWELVRIDFN
ncbi:hypothetical protein PS2_009121 [Malus domestica]